MQQLNQSISSINTNEEQKASFEERTKNIETGKILDYTGKKEF